MRAIATQGEFDRLAESALVQFILEDGSLGLRLRILFLTLSSNDRSVQRSGTKLRGIDGAGLRKLGFRYRSLVLSRKADTGSKHLG